MDVRFIARGAQLDAFRRDGIHIESTALGPASRRSRRGVRTGEVGPADLVLVVRQGTSDRRHSRRTRAAGGPATTIVTLQNGVESDEIVARRFGRARVMPAVVYVGATVEQPGHVSHVAAGTIALGVPDGADRARVERFATSSRPGKPVRMSDDIQHDRWRKLLWNASFNTVSAITGRTRRSCWPGAGIACAAPGADAEVVAVARAQGIDLQDADVDEQIAWTERAGAIRTSTTVDRERGREMEIDALIGVVVRRGAALGVPTPRSAAMLGLLKAIEAET